ncbi:MAG: primosomal protein N' [Acidobacteria bacterium]|nr:primosomal protein N' [Acidobacteriota bacterium]
MPDVPLFCDVSLPVPLDRPFTYALPSAIAPRTRPGCRVSVPFGSRRLTGVAIRVHSDAPGEGIEVKDVQRLVDDEPVLDAAMMQLAQWIASYYCAPLGEVLRGMTPLGGEIRATRTYALTDSGRDAARQFLLGTPGEEPTVQILRLLETRPLSAAYLLKKVPRAEAAVKALMKKGLISAEDSDAARDPLRSPSNRLRAQFTARADDQKLTKWERELISYLELHPGSHNLADIEQALPKAAGAARSLGRRGLIQLRPEAPALLAGSIRPPHELNRWQQAAYERVAESVGARRFEPFLLHGVTGSGKTEVYLRLIEEALRLGRGALMLVPEIGLTPAVAGQFFHRFGDRVAILHSAFTGIERVEQWRRIRRGEAAVVVGTRSGVFAPVRELGLIIVDEEHDGSYKQEETPRYNGRDVAVVRARNSNAAVVLGSATPSLESRYNAEKGKYALIEMPERIEKRPLPEVEIIDMRQEFLETRKHNTFSRALVEAVNSRLEKGEQSILILNRRGYSTFVACRSCGARLECQNCAVTLTYHRRDKRMLCHYCGYAEKVPTTCPKCGSEHIYFLGTGSEKVEDELSLGFKDARVARMDRDTVSTRHQFEKLLHGFREHSYDILVGTQMIAKGHDIPNVTFVGLVNADIGLALPDFRAAERSFQLLTQAAGRAGRGETPGTVLMQTINPEHYAIRCAAAQDYKAFYAKECEFRRLMRYPPFAALANIVLRSQDQETAMRMASETGEFLKPPPEGIKVLGPAEAPVPKLKQEFRYQLLIKAVSRKALNDALQSLRRLAVDKHWQATAMVIDVDPQTLL